MEHLGAHNAKNEAGRGSASESARQKECGEYLLLIVAETLRHIDAWKKKERISSGLPAETLLQAASRLKPRQIALAINAELLLAMHETFARAAAADVPPDRPDARSRNAGEVGTAAFLRADRLGARTSVNDDSSL